MEDKEFIKLITEYPEIKIFLEDITKNVLSLGLAPVLEMMMIVFEPINNFLEMIDNTIKKTVQRAVLEYIKNKKG